MTAEDTTNEERKQLLSERPPYFMQRCQFLARTSYWLSALVLVGAVAYFIVKMNGPCSEWHWVLFMEVPWALLALSIVAWIVSRVASAMLHESAKDPATTPQSSYGANKIFLSAVFCILAATFGLFAIYVILNMIYGN